MALTSTTEKIETWRLKHFDEETGWTGLDLEDIYVSNRNLLFPPSQLIVITMFNSSYSNGMYSWDVFLG